MDSLVEVKTSIRKYKDEPIPNNIIVEGLLQVGIMISLIF
jgi:hypothetical protein